MIGCHMHINWHGCTKDFFSKRKKVAQKPHKKQLFALINGRKKRHDELLYSQSHQILQQLNLCTSTT